MDEIYHYLTTIKYKTADLRVWFLEYTLRWASTYRQTFNIRRTFVGNKIVDHSDVVVASPIGAAPTTSF